MKRQYLIYILVLCCTILGAQDVVFKVEVTSDTLYFGNPLGVKYTIENVQGDFEPPQFDAFELVGGPNVSSQFSMVNGHVTQSASYEYILMPLDPGVVSIGMATLTNGDDTYHSESLGIHVLDNPDGIQQRMRSYGVSRSTIAKSMERQMSPEDSLRTKLRKVKARKI